MFDILINYLSIYLSLPEAVRDVSSALSWDIEMLDRNMVKTKTSS